MRRWCACLALVLAAAPARANTVLQGMATVAGGYNSNPTGTTVARGDFFDDIRPGLRLTSLFDRGLFYAQYTFDATLYLHRGAASGYSNDLSLGTLLLTSPTTSLTLTAGVLQAQINNIQALQASATAPVVTVPGGTSQFVIARASEGFNWDFTPSWRLAQLSTFAAFVPLDQSGLRQSYDLNNLVDVGRSWRRDSLALQLRVDYVAFPPTVTTSGAPVAGQDELLNGVSARWLHDFGSFFSTEVLAGLLLAMRTDGSGGFLTPIGRAAVYYRRLEGSIDLAYDHAAEPNLFTGATFINDRLALHGAVPLGKRSNMAASASLAFQHATLYDPALAGTSGSSDVWLADVSWSWTPWREMSFFARYSFTDQTGNATDPVPIPSYQRHLVMVGITIVYPAEAAAPAVFRASVRADRSDAVAIPALHAPPLPAAPAR